VLSRSVAVSAGHHGAGVPLVSAPVAVVGVVSVAEPVVLVFVVGVADAVVLVFVVVAALLVVLVAVVVGAVVVVTVVVGALVVTVVVVLVFLFAVEDPPNNVVGWPLPVMECPVRRSGTVKRTTAIANASSPVTTASRQRGCPPLDSPPWTVGEIPAAADGSERSAFRALRGGTEAESASAPLAGSAVSLAGFSNPRGGSSGPVVRLWLGTTATAGTFFAVSATVRTGRLRNSETSATTTGVAAALTSVPAPQIREAANEAATDARLAMMTVCSEMRLPER
jgi:hypothetical protein